MIVMLHDDSVIEVFDSLEDLLRSGIEAIDIENEEFQFCDDRGQRYVGVFTEPIGTWRAGKFQLRPEGSPVLQNALDLVDRAVGIKSSDRFLDLDLLRQHLLRR